MSRWTNNNKNRWRRHRRETSQVLALFLALAMVVSLGVDIGSITTTAYANEPTKEYVEGGSESSNDHDGEGEEPEIPEEAVEVEDEEEPDKDIPDDDDDDNKDGEPEDEDTDEDDSDEEESDEVEEPEGDDDTEEPEEESEEPAEDVIEPEEESLDEDNTVSNEDYDKDWIERADNALEDIDDEDLAAALVAVVKSQVGYEEQILDDTDKDVYSLYAHELYNGNNDSRDWNTTFAMWALDKAGFDTDSKGEDSDSTALPVRNDLSAWIKVVKGNDYYVNVANDGISDLEQADIAFLDLDGDEDVDHVGVVTAAKTDDDTLVSLDAVIGDLDADTLSFYVDDVKEDAADAVAKVTFSGEDYGDDAETYLEQIVTGYVDISAYLETDERQDETTDTDPDLDDDAIYGTTYSTHTNVKTLIRRVSALMMSSNDITLASDDVTDGIDMTGYLTSLKFQKKGKLSWEDATEFSTNDQVRGVLTFENVAQSTLQANGNTLYIDLPEGIDASAFVGKSYDTYDGSTKSGSYVYEKQDDGTYRIVLTLLDDYVNNAGDVIGGAIRFEFEWDGDKINDQGKIPVKIGDYGGDITVKKEDSGKKEDTSNKYTISKSSEGLSYNDDKTVVYITYKVKLTLKQDITGAATLKDVLEGDGFEYDTVYGVKVEGGTASSANYSNAQGQGVNTNIQVWPDTSGVLKAGEYTLTYRVKSTTSDFNTASNLAQSVHNKIQIPDDGNDTVSSETWTKTTTGTINKQGELVSGRDGTYIEYTVVINGGDIVKNLKTAASFSDTLPDTVELVEGSLKVTQYDVSGNPTSNDIGSPKYDSGTGQITYTTPTGQYSYIITYTTKVKDSTVIPIGGLTIENTGTSTGGVDGSSTSKVTVPNNALTKKYDDSSSEITKDESGNYTYKLHWVSKVEVEGSLSGYTYEDWSSTSWINSQTTVQMTMDMSSVVVKDSNGNTIDSTRYTLSTSDHGSPGTVDGLFKIEFGSDVTGPVTIEYDTLADMSYYKEGDYITFINYAQLTDGAGHTTKAQDQKSFQYSHTNRNVIYKYGKSWEGDNPTSDKITLSPGQKTIPWTIDINNKHELTCDLDITDTIAEGLIFLEDTLEIKTYSKDLKQISGVTWNYDETTRQLKIHIPADAYTIEYQSYTHDEVFITYKTQLPDSFFEGGDSTYTASNTASVTYDGETSDSTFTHKVTREVVGKSGSYDADEKVLSYEVIVNPDAAELNGGNLLTVEDVLKVKSSSDFKDDAALADFYNGIELISLEVFTPIKTTKADGTVSYAPGALVKTLTATTDEESKTAYEYYTEHYVNSKTNYVESVNFTTWLPDENAYIIVAKYRVDLEDLAADTALSNKVTVSGERDWKGEDSSTSIKASSSGETHTYKDVLTLVKRDSSTYHTTLEGASFELKQWNSGTWTKVADLVTGSDGKATKEDIQYNTLYKLGEVQAPDGYVLDGGPTYFIVVRESDVDNVSSYIPGSITGEKTYSTDNVKVYTVKNNTSDKIYYASVEIDRYNVKDDTKVLPGEVLVKKYWFSADGDAITDADSLLQMPDVSVTLTKHEVHHNATVIIKEGNYDNAHNVKFENVYNGAYLNVTIGQYDNKPSAANFSSSDETVKFAEMGQQSDCSYLYKIGPITGDTIIIEGTLAWLDTSCYKVDGGTDASGTTTEDIGTVTLNSSNNWTYTWTNLETNSDITYSIVETALNGYTRTYTINGSNLTEGAEFSLNESGDKVTINNTAEKSYELPSTGGSGTLLTYLLGCLAVMVSMFAGYSTWRSGERRVR